MTHALTREELIEECKRVALEIEVEHALLTGYGRQLPPLDADYIRNDHRVIALRVRAALANVQS